MIFCACEANEDVAPGKNLRMTRGSKYTSNQQDPDSSDSINDAFEDMGRYESPIIADVLLQITMVRVCSPFKITEGVNKYVRIG
ncbi:uncharacterized protein EV154DRAFT_556861 [Mucor mucedo]|uniref:uncharacterized protein n=1 Tax=Mucor mucedo TaxID=29922 RepID=UPI00221F33BE|nr:uncharacterized protein EV154DRAFT_556861 [Mucor mucedo]KAI7868380.1 hypothetical protein EV154DRAFT_556861 [Mucor mucedo]